MRSTEIIEDLKIERASGKLIKPWDGLLDVQKGTKFETGHKASQTPIITPQKDIKKTKNRIYVLIA